MSALVEGWGRLMDAGDDAVAWRGTVFRCAATSPYEDIVDFMLIEQRGVEAGFAMLVATGQKAGIPFVTLPNEAIADGDRRAVSLGWLKREWIQWVYPDCPAQSVHYRKHYPAPRGMP